MTRYRWTATVDGVDHVGCWPGVSAAEVADMVAVEARLLCGPHVPIHVRIHGRLVVPLLQQVGDSKGCPGGDSQAGQRLSPPGSAS